MMVLSGGNEGIVDVCVRCGVLDVAGVKVKQVPLQAKSR